MRRLKGLALQSRLIAAGVAGGGAPAASGPPLTNAVFRFRADDEGVADAADITQLTDLVSKLGNAPQTAATHGTFDADGGPNNTGCLVTVRSTTKYEIPGTQNGTYFANGTVFPAVLAIMKRTGSVGADWFKGNSVRIELVKWFDEDLQFGRDLVKLPATLDTKNARHTGSMTLNTWHAWLGTTTASGSQNWKLFRDAVGSAASPVATADANDANEPYDGIYNDGGGSVWDVMENVNGNLAELIIWNAELSDAERDELASYLLSQYGIS